MPLARVFEETEQTFWVNGDDIGALARTLWPSGPACFIVRGRPWEMRTHRCRASLHLYRVARDGVERSRLKLRLRRGSVEARLDRKHVSSGSKRVQTGSWQRGAAAGESIASFGQVTSAFVKFQLLITYWDSTDQLLFRIALDRMRPVDLARAENVGSEFCHIEFEGPGCTDDSPILRDPAWDAKLRPWLRPLRSMDSKWRIAARHAQVEWGMALSDEGFLSEFIGRLFSTAFPGRPPFPADLLPPRSGWGDG